MTTQTEMSSHLYSMHSMNRKFVLRLDLLSREVTKKSSITKTKCGSANDKQGRLCQLI